VVLVYSFFLAMAYNFLSAGLKLFPDKFSTALVPYFSTVTSKVKAVFFMGTGAYYAGLGFIIGIRYAAIICAGSFLSWFVIVPLLGQFNIDTLHNLNPHPGFTTAEPADIFKYIPRNIGIGGIFAAASSRF